MIKILYSEGRYAPVIVCDQSHQRIEDARLALEVTPNIHDDDLKEGQLLGVFHVHKGECDELLGKRLGDTGSSELTTHLLQLAHNVKLTPDDLAQWNEMPVDEL